MTIQELNKYYQDKADGCAYNKSYYLDMVNFHEKESFVVGNQEFFNSEPIAQYIGEFSEDFDLIGYTGGAKVINNNIGIFRENDI